jgi:adenosylhomocysteine nucleosidase
MRHQAACLAALSIACAVSCSGGAAEEARSVLVVSAYDDEQAALLGAATSVQRIVRGGRTYHVGVLAGDRVVFALTGVGIERARAATEAARRDFRLSAIVFVGVAGAVDPSVTIGDVVVPAQWAQHDTGDDPVWAAADTRLAALVPTELDNLDACDERPVCATSPRVHAGGHAVSGNRFVADPEHAEELWRRYAARTVDMETSAVAEVARAAKIPFLGIRAASDITTSGRSREHVRRYAALAARNAAAVALAFFARR